jgi:conjugative relaxase-like TrwC/TraI family protein
MIRNKQFRAGKGQRSAARYFTEHLAVSEYFANGRGLLQGETLQYLGLSKREVDAQVFAALERNEHPEKKGQRLTPRTKGEREEWGINKETGEREREKVDNRRTGHDFPFIVPKTVSMAYTEMLGGSPEDIEMAQKILQLMVQSKATAMKLAESLAETRVRIGGAYENRVTGNLLYLDVVHTDARPVGSAVPDEMLHSHTYVFNLTWDPVEKRLKAVELSQILKHKLAIDAYFMSEFERGLTELGIGTERTSDGLSFEITSVKGKEIFSKRHNEILKEEFSNRDRIEAQTLSRIRKALSQGKTLEYDKVKAQVKDELGKAIAQRKVVLTFEEKLAGLRAQMTPEIRASMQRDAVLAGERRNWRTPDEAREEVVFSVFKKESVVHEMDVVRELLRATGGAMRFEQALEFAKGPAFIHLDNEGNVTTQFVRDEERRMLRIAREGWDRYQPMVKDGATREIRNPQVRDAPDQASASRFIWNSRDLVTDVSGIGGSGKSTLLAEVVPVLRAAGHEVVILAPTSPSEKNLHKDFKEARTLQGFQKDLAFHRTLQPGTVIIVDEISMVSVPQAAWLFTLAEKKQCRVITMGDRDQFGSVERGAVIRVLQDSDSVRSTELTETYRAKVASLKATVLDLKAGRKDPARRVIAFERQDELGDIREIEDVLEMRDQAIEQHMEVLRDGYVSIMASPMHNEARQAAALVRQAMKTEGMIEQEDHELTRLVRVDREEIELRDPLHYQEGRVISFHTKVAGGFRPNEHWRVLEQQDGEIRLERKGETKRFDPTSKGKWSIYETDTLQASIGERVRITQTFKFQGISFKNGDLPVLAAIDQERVTFEDGRSLPLECLHIDQAHCVTGYATQCRTVRQIIGLAPLGAMEALDATDVYVIDSRATHRATWYTDCKDAFREAALRDKRRDSVYDYDHAVAEAVVMDIAPMMEQQREAEMERSTRVTRQPEAEKEFEREIIPDIDLQEHAHWGDEWNKYQAFIPPPGREHEMER